MLKISIVMLTTALFAGWLIVDRHESLSIAASRRIVVASNDQPAGTMAAQGEPSPIAGPVVVQTDNQSVKPATDVPALSNDKSAEPDLSIAAPRLHVAAASRERMDKRSRRRIAHHAVRTARWSNVERRVTRHA
jgi:hypothetical protein